MPPPLQRQGGISSLDWPVRGDQHTPSSAPPPQKLARSASPPRSRRWPRTAALAPGAVPAWQQQQQQQQQRRRRRPRGSSDSSGGSGSSARGRPPTMEAELRRALQSQAGVKCADAGLLAQLGAAAASHGLTAKEVASRLGAHLLNSGAVGSSLSAPAVEHFLSVLQREVNKENRGGATPNGAKWDGARDWAGFTDTLGAKADQQGTPVTPTAARTAGAARGGAAGGQSPGATPPSAPRSAFKTRTNRGQVVSTLNPHVPKVAGGEARMVHVEPRGVQLPSRHVYMLERLEDKVAATNARIAAWRKWLGPALGAEAAPAAAAAGQQQQQQQLEVAPVGVPAQEDTVFVGRVVCDVEGASLNEASVLLEGDTSTSEGRRVPLDLSALPAFRLFPGQMVAVRGVNPSGGRILAKQLWTHLPPPPGGAAAPMEVDGEGGALSAVVAAGPYCIADDVAFDPLQELLQELKGDPPQLLVLLGPFVDVDQPLVAGGMLSVTFQQLFQSQVVERLQAWQAALAAPCQVVLVPAVRDAFHHPTFPQPAFDLQPQDQMLVSLQNPCAFTAGPLLVAGMSTDVLRHLSAAELARAEPGVAADRLGALASHVIGQRRLYPLYPAPPGTCLDLTADAALELQQLPDLLLLPSDLAPFAKLVAAPPAMAAGGGCAAPGSAAAQGAPQVVALNPGRLAKGSGGGTYARVSVAEGAGALADRCRVDIVRV